MPDIFVNYRTGDEESTATMIARELSRRFGEERVFIASNSIPPGHKYPQELVAAASESSALLAVIGERWADARTAEGHRALDLAEDWTRREILTALEHGSLVIPVLVGRATRLDRSTLPKELKELADCQYRRFDHRNVAADLVMLGDCLAELLPLLAAADTDRTVRSDRSQTEPADRWSAGPSNARMHARDVHQNLHSGIGTLNGDLSGTFVNEPQAPVNTGRGNQYNAPHFDGDNRGVNYTAGDNSSEVRQQFDGECRQADDER